MTITENYQLKYYYADFTNNFAPLSNQQYHYDISKQISEELTHQFVMLFQFCLKEVLHVLLVGHKLFGDVIILDIRAQLSIPRGALCLHLVDLAEQPLHLLLGCRVSLGCKETEKF